MWIEVASLFYIRQWRARENNAGIEELIINDDGGGDL
jgi:hypothetical protein